MKDRLPTPGKENRVRLTLDNGTILEGVLSYADEATVEGSAYTKGNVLPDEVCDVLGISRTEAEPKDAFLSVVQMSVLPSAYASDLYLYISGQHPILNAGLYCDYWEIERMQRMPALARDIDLTGEAETITVYDGGK